MEKRTTITLRKFNDYRYECGYFEGHKFIKFGAAYMEDAGEVIIHNELRECATKINCTSGTEQKALKKLIPQLMADLTFDFMTDSL